MSRDLLFCALKFSNFLEDFRVDAGRIRRGRNEDTSSFGYNTARRYLTYTKLRQHVPRSYAVHSYTPGAGAAIDPIT